MIRAAAIGMLAVCLVGTTDRSAPPPQDRPGPGVSLTLAEERVRRVSDIRYDLHFTIPSDAASRVGGTVEIRFALADATRPLALDFVAPAPVHAESHGHQIDLVEVFQERVQVGGPIPLVAGRIQENWVQSASQARANRGADTAMFLVAQ